MDKPDPAGRRPDFESIIYRELLRGWRDLPPAEQEAINRRAADIEAWRQRLIREEWMEG